MNNFTDITVELHHETDGAILVSDDGKSEKAVWVPKSQVSEMVMLDEKNAEITIPEWLAFDKGLI